MVGDLFICYFSTVLCQLNKATTGFYISRPSMIAEPLGRTGDCHGLWLRTPSVRHFSRACQQAGNSARRSLTVRAVTLGEVPGPIDGAPMLVKLVPEDKTADIMVSMPIVVTFSEPINSDTLNANSFQLIDLTTGAQVAADIYTGIEGGMMKATLQPRTNLDYGHEYEIVLTQGIKDSNSNRSQIGESLPLDQEYRYRSTTKVPDVYDLAGGFDLTPGGRGGVDIALYTDRESGRTYSYLSAGLGGW